MALWLVYGELFPWKSLAEVWFLFIFFKLALSHDVQGGNPSCFWMALEMLGGFLLDLCCNHLGKSCDGFSVKSEGNPRAKMKVWLNLTFAPVCRGWHRSFSQSQ